MSWWTPGERGIVALAAEMAPSVHNTQPWVLRFHDDARDLSLFERPDVALPQHDPLGRDRRISCGAALTNVVLAIRALGWVPEVVLRPDHDRPHEVARIGAHDRSKPTDTEFAQYLATTRRHSYRSPFMATPVDAETLRLMTALGVDGVEVRLLHGAEETAVLAKLLDHTALVLRADRAYQSELSAWTSSDEYPVAGVGVAALPWRDSALPWAGLVRRSTAVPDLETLTDRLRRECLLLVQTPDDGPLDQLRAGMAAEHVWLAATDAGLVGSVLTQPFQLSEVRAGLVEALSLAGYPQLLFRLGHPRIDHPAEMAPADGAAPPAFDRDARATPVHQSEQGSAVMRVRDIMSRPVISVDATTTVREAITVLAEHGFATTPVVDDSGRVVGIFSESDGLRADPRGTELVGRTMASPVEVVGPGTAIAVVAERMLAGHYRSLPVVEEGLLIGIVARRDLLRTLIRDDDVVRGKVRALLDDYAGSRRHWSVEISVGTVTVSGDFADDAERSVVAALVRTVSGVSGVELVSTAQVSLGWDD